jgi:hypothetical protein
LQKENKHIILKNLVVGSWLDNCHIREQAIESVKEGVCVVFLSLKYINNGEGGGGTSRSI